MEMDCIRTQAATSALHDSEVVTDENAEAAREHLAACEQCRAFESDLGALQDLEAPKAPPALIGRIMVAVSAIAAEQDAEAHAGDAEPAAEVAESRPESTRPRFSWSFAPVRWGAYGVLATAAAALVIAVVVSVRMPARQTAAERAATATSSGAVDLTFSNQATKVAPTAPAPAPAPARAPDYVVFRGRVYAPGALLADSAAATQSVGTITTAFGGAAAPSQVPAYRSPVADGSIVVAGPDGSRLYSPVIRMWSSVKYQLVAGNAVDRFGTWPELPSRFPKPTSPDGLPTFAIAGGDALGVQTYVAKGVPQTQGFAVAPGTPSSDPAGSNPNWTWWEPMLMP